MNSTAALKNAEIIEPPGWPEVRSFAQRTAPEPYPLDALPGVLRDAVTEVQQYMQAPLPMVAQSALAAAATVAQGLADVRRDSNLSGPISLFLLAIAESGERKTAVDKLFVRPIREWQAATEQALEPERKKNEAMRAAWAAKVEGVKQAIKQAAKSKDGSKNLLELEIQLQQLHLDEPAPLKVPEYLLADETPESLAFRLRHLWPVAAIASNEAGVIFGSHGMSKDSAMRNLGQLNVLWDGGELSIGRRVSETFRVRDCRLSVSLQVQRGTLQGFLQQQGALCRDIGFLARFLVCEPQSTQGQRPYREPPQHWPALERFSQRIRQLLDIGITHAENGGAELAMMDLSPEARQHWIVYHDTVEHELRPHGDLTSIRDVASKSAENAARLAGVFHIFEHGAAGEISAETFKGAARLAAWYLTEALRFHGEFSQPEEYRSAAKLESWLLTRPEPAVLRSDALQAGPTATRSAAKLDAAMAVLIELGRAREIQPDRHRLIELNPALRREVAP